jgi:hypothetical protein
MNVKIKFSASGTVSQLVDITDPSITIADIQKGLKEGTIATTIQEFHEGCLGGLVLLRIGTNWMTIGKVISVYNELEYTDYEASIPD